MKIAITGASGFIGMKLTQKFLSSGFEIIQLKRDDFNSNNFENLKEKINGCDIVINLAGATIAKRWSGKYKKILYNSRINTTKTLVQAINNLPKKPEKFISVSAIGIYDNFNTHSENSKNFGSSFLSKICFDWETEARKVNTKLIIPRLSIVLDKNEGAFKKMILPFKFGLGIIFGNGNQYFSWIHIDDLVSAFMYFVENTDCEGVYNLSTGEKMTYNDFAKICKKKYAYGLSVHLPVFFLKLILKEGHIVLTKGQLAIPERLKNENFNFKFSFFSETINNLILN